MLLTGEVKDKGYEEPLRQQEAMYAPSSDVYLKADAQTGKHFYDLNAASRSYAGPWLFGKENVQCFVGRLKAQWVQWCPVPADLRDGVYMRGNVIYENPDGTSKMSTDMFEGELHTEHGRRFFIGRTQHTFYGQNLPGGSMKVIAELNIFLNQRLPHNPLMVPPSQAIAQSSPESPRYSQPANYSPSPDFSPPEGYQQQRQQPSPPHYVNQGYQPQMYPQRGYEANYSAPTFGSNNYPQQSHPQPNSQQPGNQQPNYQQQQTEQYQPSPAQGVPESGIHF